MGFHPWHAGRDRAVLRAVNDGRSNTAPPRVAPTEPFHSQGCDLGL
jgi:hypothetical protein